MEIEDQLERDAPAGIGLRTELSLRSLHLAKTLGYLHERTDGQVPGIIFGRDENGRHGSFHPAAYQRICARESEASDKVHTASKRMRVRSDWQWKELDCLNSSDVLLMNVFCYPGVTESTGIRALLNLKQGRSLSLASDRVFRSNADAG